MDLKKMVVLLCVAWMGAGAFAFSLLGPPTAELEKTTRRTDKEEDLSRWEDRHGYIFSFSQMDVGVGNETVEDFELTRHYYTWGIALDENFNFNVLIGAASGEADKDSINSALDGITTATSGFDGDYEFSFGFNFKSTFYHGEKVDWGAMYQMTWFSADDTGNTVADGPVDVEIDYAYDIQVAVGPTVDMGGWKLYGGAYYYMLDGDMDYSGSGVGSGSFDIDEDDNFGGFVGTQFDIWENTDLIVEYAMGNDSYSFGLSVGVTF